MKQNIKNVAFILFILFCFNFLLGCSVENSSPNLLDEDNLVVEEVVPESQILELGQNFYQGEADIQTITSITFCIEAPDSYEEKWIANVANDPNGILGYRCNTDIYIVGEKIYLNPYSQSMFSKEQTFSGGWPSLENISGLEILDTSLVKNMSQMFFKCDFLTELDLSMWDVSEVEDMSFMFASCKNLKAVNVSTWDVSNVKNFCSIFQTGSSYEGDGKIETLDVSNWDTSSATDMGWMFYSCGSIKSLNVSNWDVSNVTSFDHMFGDCNSLEELDLSNWSTDSVKIFACMFNDCHSLTVLDLSNFKTSFENVTETKEMFKGSKVKNVYLPANFKLN